MAERHVVGEGAGRLDSWLAQVSGRSRAEAARLVDAGAVLVDGTRQPRSHRPAPGQVVTVEDLIADDEPAEMPAFKVAYEDEHLLVVSKGPGVVVHPGAGTRGPTLVDAVAVSTPLAPAAGEDRPGVVHRLDRDTSGLLLFAKTDPVHAALTADLRSRAVSRGYTALVAGGFDAATGRIEASISRSTRDRRRMTVAAEGRQAATEFRVAEKIGGLTLLEVALVTGRTHQIRVHLSHIGRPVVGDRTYGRSTLPVARRLGLSRQFLHAHMLTFLHPVSGATVEVTDELADDLLSALAAARKDLG